MENCFDDFPDLVGKLCKVLKIEKYSDEGRGPWVLSFSCEGINYSIRLDYNSITENKKLLLKSEEFKFIVVRHSIQVKPIKPKDEEVSRRSYTSKEVWLNGFGKKYPVNCGYLRV
jgi:hypothetical protein